MKKRLIGMLLAGIMLLMLLPVTAFAGAEKTYPLFVSGVQVTDANKTDVLADSSVSFDPEKGILTLNNATLSTTGQASGFSYGIGCVCAVKSELDALTVRLIGNNQAGKPVNADSPFEDYSIDLGFSCTGDIAFIGDAASSLTVYDYGAGIVAKNVTFGKDFKGKLTVRDCGGPEPQPPCAINARGVFEEITMDYVSDGAVSILGGTFDIVSFMSNGIEADGSVTVSNAKIKASAAYNAIASEHGDVTVRDSELTAVGDTGVYAGVGNVLIENTDTDIRTTACEGINGRDITLKNCEKVTVKSTEDSLYSGRKVSIINCPDIVLDSNELSGIAGHDVLIDNSTVTVTAREGNGIRASYDEDGAGNGGVTVKDSAVTIRATRHGIECSSLSALGGKTYIYAVGDTDSDGKGCGAYIVGDESAIGVSDGTVKLTGGEAAIKLEKKADVNPYSGNLPKASFKGNTAFDTFTSMQNVSYQSAKASFTYCETAYIGDELAKSVSVMHVHALRKADGKAATANEAGFKSYYKCNCGRFFEDAEGKTEIPDLEKWKAAGGRGYIPKLGKEPTPTGDESIAAPWLLLLALSSAGLCACLVLGKKIRYI